VDTGTGLDVPPAGIRTPDRPTPGLVSILTLLLVHSMQVFPHRMTTRHVATKSNFTYKKLHDGYTAYYSYRFVPFLVYSPTSSSSYVYPDTVNELLSVSQHFYQQTLSFLLKS